MKNKGKIAYKTLKGKNPGKRQKTKMLGRDA